MGRINQIDHNRVLVVCGMHRSHTSFLASWLISCGLHMGDRLMPPDIGNPRGFYEDLDFVELHERILNENNTSPFSSDISLLKLPTEIKSEAITVLDQKNTSNKQWGWKDPRTCLVFGSLWHSLIPQACVIVIYRHFSEVVDSCYEREIELAHRAWSTTYRKFRNNQETLEPITQFKEGVDKIRKRISPPYSKKELLANWNHYNTKCVELTQIVPVENIMFVKAEELLNYDIAIHEHISNNWGFNLQYRQAAKIWIDPPQIRKHELGSLDTSTSQHILDQLNSLNRFL